LALAALDDHQQNLLATPAEALRDRVAGRPSAFDPATDWQPMHPPDTGRKFAGHVFYGYLQKQAPKAWRTSLGSIANIYQLQRSIFVFGSHPYGRALSSADGQGLTEGHLGRE